MSSRAFQFWLNNTNVFTSKSSKGLYETGGSRHGIRIFRLLSNLLGFKREVRALIDAKTLNEQREIWAKKIRPIIISRLLSYLVVGQEKFLWAALGVPHNQLAMLEADYIASHSGTSASPLEHSEKELRSSKGAAIWEYMVQTLDPVIENCLIGEDNPYYLVCLQGHYTQRCHPDYLKPKSHQKLSRGGAFDGLRIHTDEIDEVVMRLTPGTLTVAVVMDSMDWFDPGAEAAGVQIRKLNRALKLGGRVLLRSAALSPWYIATFESLGFEGKRVGARTAGACIDRFVSSTCPFHSSSSFFYRKGVH
jgi:betaine lipid synthase